MGRIVWVIAMCVGLAGLYLFLAGSVDTVEMIAMVVCASAATALAVGLEVVAKRHYGALPPAKAILRPFAALLPEALVVGRELVAVTIAGATRMRGDFVRQPFEPGADEARAATRRALTIIGVSLAPRTFVVRGERSDALLLHGLPPKPASADRTWPA